MGVQMPHQTQRIAVLRTLDDQHMTAPDIARASFVPLALTRLALAQLATLGLVALYRRGPHESVWCLTPMGLAGIEA